MTINIPEHLTDEILTQFATGEPRSDIVTFLYRHSPIQEQLTEDPNRSNAQRVRDTLSDKLRAYDPTHRRFAEKYRDKYNQICEATQAEFGERAKAFVRKKAALLQQDIEKREALNVELEAALETFVEGDANREGLEIEDPGEAIQVMNAIKKNRKLIIDDTKKLSQIADNP